MFLKLLPPPTQSGNPLPHTAASLFFTIWGLKSKMIGIRKDEDAGSPSGVKVFGNTCIVADGFAWLSRTYPFSMVLVEFEELVKKKTGFDLKVRQLDSILVSVWLRRKYNSFVLIKLGGH